MSQNSSAYANKPVQNLSRLFCYAMNSSISDYYSKQCKMPVLILQFSAILTEILIVLKIDVNA